MSMFLVFATLYWTAFGLLALVGTRTSTLLGVAALAVALLPPAFLPIVMIWRDVLFGDVARSRNVVALVDRPKTCDPVPLDVRGLTVNRDRRLAASQCNFGCPFARGLRAMANAIVTEKGSSILLSRRYRHVRDGPIGLLRRIQSGEATPCTFVHGLRSWRH
jgi:hypothetical protein